MTRFYLGIFHRTQGGSKDPPPPGAEIDCFYIKKLEHIFGGIAYPLEVTIHVRD